MPILSIKTYPDKLLRQKARLVGKIGREVRNLASDMIETMRSADGVGLAGPQVGIGKRIIVVQDIEDDGPAAVFINPKILRKKGSSRICEGCLSVPGVTADIVRPESIVLEALDVDGKKLKIETGGLLARIVQHEIDHLDGVLFIDRVGFLRRKKIMKQVSKNVCMEL
ncbi:MAG: peptide deformylase [Candidatus Omnitrophica bacterium]|nr:peptide deformylase [Candidatus Omnitrophota bacterium]